MKKLRLLLFEECNRNCEGCCNKDWNLSLLPIEDEFSQYSEIMLTGGEPMLKPLYVIEIAKRIRRQTSIPKIYLYTAKTDKWEALLAVLHFIDGLCVTLHKESDVLPFLIFANILGQVRFTKSLRLNVFKGIEIGDIENWTIKRNMEWIKDCPLPDNEVFKRV